MTTYQPPTEDLIAFNSSVFTTANEVGMTLSEAQSLFLGRTGTPTSTATLTSFTGGDIVVNGVRAGVGLFKSGTDALVNTAFGRNALNATTSATNSCGVGNGALTALTTGEGNTCVGSLAGNAIIGGQKNTAVGSACLKFATSGNRNTGIGNASGQTLTSGSDNTVCGYLAGGSITTGSFNTNVGANSNVTSGATNSSTALGAYSSIANFSNSTAIGGGSNTVAGATCTANNQIMLGRATEFVEMPGTTASGSLITAADIFVNGVRAGVGSFQSDTNTCFGKDALFTAATTSLNNCAFGTNALKLSSGTAATTGFGNCAFGYFALQATTTGFRNTGIGAFSLGRFSAPQLTTGSRNTGCGYAAGIQFTAGASDNTNIGNARDNAAYTEGSANTLVGSQSSLSLVGNSLVTVNASTTLGAFTSINGFSNSTAIGGGTSTAVPGAVCSAANQIMLGRATETVECPGTVSSISLKTARNISINGTVFGIGVAGSNSLFSGLTTGAGNGAGNTLYGSGSYANSSDGSSARNTVIGALTMANTNTSYNDVTVLGYGCANSGFGTVERITLLGATTSATANDSTAIGYGASATAANQIVLGRTSETVECVGTASSISLKTARNILVNGMVFGTGTNDVTNGNIFIGQTSGSNGNGITNTVMGHGAFTSAINTSSEGNTIIGSNAGKDINAKITTCTIVGQGSYTTTTTAYNGASCLGHDCQIGGANSTAIGIGAATTAANQIKLGRTTEFVECAGTDNTNGCLKLNGGLKLQTAYGAVPSATMLGYKVVTTGTAVVLTTATISNLVNVSVPVGVWNVSFSVSVTVTSGGNVTAQDIVFSATTASTTALSTICGQCKSHSSDTYATNDVYIVSNSFEYQTTSATNIYLNMLVTKSGGAALTATGFVSLTRMG